MKKSQLVQEQIAANSINFKAYHMKALRRRLASVALTDKFNRSDTPTPTSARLDLTTDSMNIINLN